MFMGPFDSGGDFRDSGIQGTTRFLERVWKLSGSVRFANKGGEDIDRHLHRTIKKVTDDIEVLAYNTAISALMIQLNQFEESRGFVSEGQFAAFVQLIAPFAPHIAEEIWSKLYGARIKSIHVTAWPKYDPKLLVDSSVTLVIQVNGKVRSTVSVNRGISEEEAVKIALADPKVKQILSGQYTKRVIFVKDRLVNFVI